MYFSRSFNKLQKIVEEVWNSFIVIPVGYTENVFGYLSISSEIDQGGYESKDFFPFFKVKGKYI